ncbi:dimethyladenosine transferase 2, mitochondrial [Ischnura elegans]|uniref:dimethyladenosine transferase 2, mitochondrial n=1 Tax=Ischnura elegans TaxID=197161 RepID=UPI001ED87D8E|nr:dimethyladenosine transferase 2, mitochondrial [Ischnura elegans]
MSQSLKELLRRNNFSYCITNSILICLRRSKVPPNFYTFHGARIRGFCDVLSSKSDERNSMQVPKVKKPRKKPPSAQERHLEKFYSHLRDCNEGLDIKSIPNRYISSAVSSAEGLYVVGLKTADIIANELMESNVNTPIIEVNPGVGIVTEALLRKGAREVHTFQSSLWEGQKFQGVEDKDARKVVFYKNDFFSIWKRLLLDYFDDDSQKALLNIVKPKPWSAEPPAKIFAAMPNKSFINHMIASIVFQKGFFQIGRLEFYLAIRPHDYLSVTADGTANYLVYRAVSVLFQIMFERKILCRLPAKDFIPWIKPFSARMKQYLPKLSAADADCIYLVKIIPRKDVHDLVEGEDGLKTLWHFVRQCFTSRSNRVIPTLEKWIPGCGPRLIFNNMTIYTQFGELSPQQVLKLFQDFTKWPEYPHCSFLDSLEAYLLKSYMEKNPDGISEADFESADGSLEEDHDYEPDTESRRSKRA